MSLNAKVLLLFGKLQTSICGKYFQNRWHYAKTNIKIGINDPKNIKKHLKKETNKNLLPCVLRQIGTQYEASSGQLKGLIST